MRRFGAWPAASTPALIFKRNARVGIEASPCFSPAASPHLAGHERLHLPIGIERSISSPDGSHFFLARKAAFEGGHVHHHHDGIAGATLPRVRRPTGGGVLRGSEQRRGG